MTPSRIEDARRDSVAPGNDLGMIIALALPVALWLAAFAAYWPGAPKRADASPTEFSAARAVALLNELDGDSVPHPLGSTANAVVRDRIMQRLRLLGYAPELQSGAFVCNPYAVCGAPVNIIARLEGSGDGPSAVNPTTGESMDSVLLAAHYDSVPVGPGASDDGAGVAEILEIARTLKFRPRSRHPIILLIDEGEEDGLLGAEAFVQHHPWARSVKAAVNIDNRGTSGANLMFETGSANAWLMRLYAHAVARPLTNSVFYAIYKHLPNDTDFSVFKTAGYQGFNFAYIGDVANYHTPQDDIQHVDQRSIQQQGEQALAALLTLANSDIDRPPAGEAVFFDLYGRVLVRLPQRIMLPAALCTLFLLLISAALIMRRGLASGRELAWAIAALVLASLGAIVIGEALLALLRVISPAGVPAFAAYPWVLIETFTALAAGIIVAVSMSLHSRVGFWGLWSANSLWAALAASALAFWLPGASYWSLAPAIVGLVALATQLRGGLNCSVERELATIAYLLVTFTLLWPIIIPLYAGLGTGSLPLLSLLLVFGAAPLAGLLLQAGERPRGLFAGTSIILVFLGAALAVAVPQYTAHSPQRLNILYEIEQKSAGGESTGAYWLALPESGHLPREFQRTARFHFLEEPPLQPFRNWSWQRVFSAKAPLLNIPAPQLLLLSATISPDQSTPQHRVHYRVRISSIRSAPTLQVAFSPAAQVQSVCLSSATVTAGGPATVRPLKAQHGWTVLSFAGLPTQGIELTFDAADSAFDVNLLDESYGLPPPAHALLPARLQNATASHDGDMTVVAVQVHVPQPR